MNMLQPVAPVTRSTLTAQAVLDIISEHAQRDAYDTLAALIGRPLTAREGGWVCEADLALRQSAQYGELPAISVALTPQLTPADVDKFASDGVTGLVAALLACGRFDVARRAARDLAESLAQ